MMQDPATAGELSPADAIASGSVRRFGEPALLERFAQIFRIEPMPPASPIAGSGAVR